MKKELVSVIIPIFNSEKTLELCIKSVIDQSYKNLEIILVNDGSNDDSLMICRKFEKIDCRIKIINQSNKGEGGARNSGLKIASGKYVTFLDSDDELPKKAIENLVSNMNTEFVIGGIIKRNKREEKIFTPKSKIVNGKDEISKFMVDTKYMYFVNCIASKLFILEIIQSNNLHFTKKKYGADTHFVYSYLNCITSMQFIDKNVYIVNSVENSMSNRIVENSWQEMVELYELGKKIIFSGQSQVNYKLLLRSIKTALYLDSKRSYSIFNETCISIMSYLYENDLMKLKKEGSVYENLIYFLMVHKIFLLIYLILRFRIKKERKRYL